MGRATYDIGRAPGVTSPSPHLRQGLVSASLDDTPDPAVEVVTDDPVGRVRARKAETGRDIWLCGGGRRDLVLSDHRVYPGGFMVLRSRAAA